MLSETSIVRVCIFVILMFACFAAVAFSTHDQDMGIVGTSAKMEFAFSWTLRMAGSLIAIIAAIGLIRFAGQSDSAERMLPGSIALLGGLLLLSQHWVVVSTFGVLMIAFILQQTIIRRPVQTARWEPGVANKEPGPNVAATGIRADHG